MATHIFRTRPLWLKLLVSFVLLLAALLIALIFFPWDVLREPVNRYVSEKTGRKFEITRRLDVDLGWRTATVRFDGIEFTNPEWARDPYLVKADRAEFDILDIRIWPLVGSKVVLPRLSLFSPTLGLQMEADGRRTWALGKDTSDPGTVPSIGLIQVDTGAVDFLAKHLGVDLHADLSYDSNRGEMPLSYRIKGRYKGQPLTANGRTGNVMQINAAGAPPFPLEISAAAGQTQLKASGTVAELSGLDGIDAKFELKGQTLGALFPLLGIALPQTSPYALSGDLSKRGKLWAVAGLKGKLGLSDIAGDMRFDQAGRLPHLAGDLRSKVMDMDDLGPLIGLPPTARTANAVEGVAAPPTITQVKRPAGGKVLPTAPLDFERLRAMNADVKYTADRIRNVREVPLDRGSVQVKLNDGVLTLDPLDLGVGDGKLVGAIRIDAAKSPADIRASLDLRGMQLARLFPKLETTGNSVGRLNGRLNLSGPGSSVANWLGGASGDVAVLSGRGQFGNLLPVFATLVGGDIIKFLLRGDRNIELRCAAVAFDVNKGLMTGRTLVVDTTNAVFVATGQASLANETLDFVVHPEPKSKNILSIRTPLVVSGTFGDPKGGVQIAPLAGRGLAALALGTINPLLALAATIETGPGEDSDCKGVLAQANRPTAGAAAKGAARAKGARQP